MDRNEKGYRLYSDMQITMAKILPFFYDIGLRTSEIRNITQERTPERLRYQLMLQRDKIMVKSQCCEEAFALIDTTTGLLDKALSIADEMDSIIHELPKTPILLAVRTILKTRKIPADTACAAAESHPGAYQTEMAKEFGCSESAIRKALKKLLITRKKRQRVIGSNTPKK